jgi:hypothetical protein
VVKVDRGDGVRAVQVASSSAGRLTARHPSSRLSTLSRRASGPCTELPRGKVANGRSSSLPPRSAAYTAQPARRTITASSTTKRLALIRCTGATFSDGDDCWSGGQLAIAAHSSTG